LRIIVEEVRLVIKGKVQGVFYRAWAQRSAVLLGINGFCRNLLNGTVEIVGQGRRGALEEFIQRCYDGPNGAKVESIEVFWRGETETFPSFQVR